MVGVRRLFSVGTIEWVSKVCSYTLIIQYGAGGDGNYPAGKYDLLGVTMLKDEDKAIVLGERIRFLK